MRLLLDTHLLLWWLSANSQLPKAALQLIADPANTIFISAVSLWEIWLKLSIGKLDLPDDFANRLRSEQFENLPVSAEHTRQTAFLPWHHRDPFDRMLVAQAQVEKLTLLTVDGALSAYGPCVRLVRSSRLVS